MDVLKKLNELKKVNNWSDYRIAKESGLSSATITNIYSRGTLPRVDTLEAICKAFGLTMSQFFHDENERYVFLNDSQLKLFEQWESLSEKKKAAFAELLQLIVKDNEE